MADYARLVTLKITPETERIIRNHINAYANSTSGHPFRNYGDQIKIKELDRCNLYYSSLRTQYDKRTVQDKKIPYDGRSVGGLTIRSASEVNPWNYQLFRTQQFLKHTQEYTAPGSESVKDCSRCGTTGKDTCPVCSGRKRNRCPDCNDGMVKCSACDNGRVKCNHCGGRGYTERSETQSVIVDYGPPARWETRTVYNKVTCTYCHNGYNRCQRCGGRGEVTCKKCGGSASIPCSTCGESGKVKCSGCSGRGRNLHYVGIDQELFTRFDQKITYDSLLSKIPELVDPKATHRMTVLYDSTAEHLDRDLIPEDSKMSQNLNGFLSAHETSVDNGTRILFQQARILKVDVWYVEYEYKGKRYYGAIADDRFYAGHSPISEYGENLIKGADKNIGGMGTVEARQMLDQAEKMKVFGASGEINRLRSYVNRHLNLMYNTGIDLAFWIIVLFGMPFLLEFYSNLNPLPGVLSFMNDPSWKLYDMLPSVQCVIFFAALWYLRRRLKAKDHSGQKYKTVFGFLGAGMGIYVCYAMGILAVLIFANILGLSLITTFVGNIVWKIISIVITIVVFVLWGIFSVIKWIVGLFA